MSASLTDYANYLRNFIKDHDFLNRLLKFKDENDFDELKMYMDMALNFVNMVPPIVVAFDFGTFPMPQLLIHQGAIEAMISNNILQARNDLTYNNGGITVKISDGNRYLNTINLLLRMTDREIAYLTQFKISANIEGSWGGVMSPYSRLHGRQQTLNPNTLLSG